jgi:hypothetical protein
MFERFTDRARRVVVLAQEEARHLDHNYLGTEHILLGLIREGEGVAAQVLIELGGSLDRVRQQVIQILANASQLQAEQVGGMQSRISQQQAMAMVAGGPGVYQDEPAELVRVVPVAREVHREAGMRVVLISLEIWSGWIDLRFAMLPGSSSGGRIQWLLDWQIDDDAGTTYEKAGMATGGGQQLHVTQLGFRPAPPEGARTLTLTLVDGDEPTAPMAVVEIELATEA